MYYNHVNARKNDQTTLISINIDYICKQFDIYKKYV